MRSSSALATSSVDAAAKRYAEERSEDAKTVKQLVEAGYLPSEPIDPFGGLILLRDNRSYSTVSKRLEVFEHKGETAKAWE